MSHANEIPQSALNVSPDMVQTMKENAKNAPKTAYLAKVPITVRSVLKDLVSRGQKMAV